MIKRPQLGRAGKAPGVEMINSCIEEHLNGRARMRRLRDYYDGRHSILERRRFRGLPNNRMMHGFARYISTMATGYLIGNPVGYVLKNEEEAGQKRALENILAQYKRCAADSVDAELARCASIYGKGVEILFSDGESRPGCAALNPEDAFVVYDDTVENKPMFGVHFCEKMLRNGKTKGYRVCVYTQDMVYQFDVKDPTNVHAEDMTDAWEHHFGMVPMIEYWNGEDEKGDFEDVIGLIDAYDLLQSDRMNDKEQFVDALLLLYGCTLETDEAGRSPGQQLREDKVLSLPDSDARAEWLCKQMNETDLEVLRRAIVSDIHKLSMVPDLTDEQFAGNSSGVAMRYKLLGLEQLTRIKERWFREALTQRLEMFAHFMAMRGCVKLKSEGVKMVFSRALPVNELEIAQTVNMLKDVAPQEQLMKLVTFLGN